MCRKYMGKKMQKVKMGEIPKEEGNKSVMDSNHLVMHFHFH